jgi:hypothetical protein
MKLIDDCRDVWHKLWSIRLSILAAVLAGCEILSALQPVLPLLPSVLPPGMFAGLSALVALAAAGSRVIKQERL